MPYLRAFAFIAVMAATFLFLVPLQALAQWRGWAIQHRLQMGFCRIICAIIGIKVESRGALQGAAPRLIVANHVSWTDVITLASLHPFVFLAKSEVARWPALGFLARLQGTIFVERGARKDAARANTALAETLRTGRDIVIFAEGTSSDGMQVLPFRSAHFAPLEILGAQGIAPALTPVAIAYSDCGMWIDVGWYGDMTFLPHLWMLMKRGGAHCEIAFGAPIAAQGKNRKTLALESAEKVREMLCVGH